MVTAYAAPCLPTLLRDKRSEKDLGIPAVFSEKDLGIPAVFSENVFRMRFCLEVNKICLYLHHTKLLRAILWIRLFGFQRCAV